MKDLFKGYDVAANIHRFTMGDLNFLLDVNSGAVHVLDTVAREFVDVLLASDGDIGLAQEHCYRIYGQEQVDEAEREIRAAVEEQSLFTREELPLLDLEQAPVKALCLNVAHACNMKCRYCFAGQGDFGAEKGLMSEEVGRRALDFLLQESREVRNLEVDFFGGEPLLNYPVVQRLVAYGRRRAEETGKNIRFTLTTNAVALTPEIMDFIVREGISVILSLDGRPEVNDRYRLLRDGRGSYDIIVARIQAMVAKQPVSYYIRGTFCRENLDFTRDLEHLISCGFTNISLEPAVGDCRDLAIGEEELPRVLLEYDRLTEVLWSQYCQGRKVNFFHFNLDLNRGPCLAKRLTGCGAGIEYLAVTPGGDIYPCHQFVGVADFLMGNVKQGIVNRSIKQRFACSQLANKKECRSCWARFFCGGGCHAGAYYVNHDLRKPAAVSCTMHRKRVECAIYLETRKRLAQHDNYPAEA